MFQKALLRHKQMNLFQSGLATRSMRTVAGKSYVMADSVDDVVKSLDKLRPTYTLIYFSAAWNPVCA